MGVEARPDERRPVKIENMQRVDELLKRLRSRRSSQRELASQRVQWGLCFRVIASLNASINTFLHPFVYTDADQIVMICGLQVFVLFFVSVGRSYERTQHKFPKCWLRPPGGL